MTAPRRIRLNLGCGRDPLPDAINLDRRPFPGVAVVCDARALPFAGGCADEVLASSLLEHLLSPYEVLDEAHRVLREEGRLLVRVPCLGTHAAHADPTHRFLADLKAWRQMLQGYFTRVRVGSEGVRFRGSKLLAAINHVLVKVCRFHELAQALTFECRGRRPAPTRQPGEWWIERDGRVVGHLESR